jgi:pimeloyl-ACP methyl ester carboxylesterase
MGVQRSLEGHLSPSDETFILDLMGTFLPISARAAGVINDIVITNPDLNDTRYVSLIKVPTMVFHAKDDPWGAFNGAEEIVSRIPNARFRPISEGGHLLLGHRADVASEMSQFMKEHSAGPL